MYFVKRMKLKSTCLFVLGINIDIGSLPWLPILGLVLAHRNKVLFLWDSQATMLPVQVQALMVLILKCMATRLHRTTCLLPPWVEESMAPTLL